ncbi:MAG: TAXI family TRAP transporter solute-binding subunit [Halarsenatibacteraceae bacterium]
MKKNSIKISKIMTVFLIFALLLMPATVQAITEVDWGTSSVGSSGHRALVALTTILNREMEDYTFNVLPTAGAVQTVKQYTMNQTDGMYGADVGFYEFANNIDRFEGFADYVEREPIQSFWGYTLEVGLAINADDIDEYTEWRDLAGEPVFTGPAPWDVRAALKRPLEVLEVGHEYVEIDLSMAGSSLAAGHVKAINAYTSGEKTVSPWILEAELATDIAILNPSPEEIEILEAEGLQVVEIDPDVFETDVHVDTVIRVPFFYGFHTGPDVIPEEDMYNMLNIIYENTGELAEQDAIYGQIHQDMVDIQYRGVQATIDDVKVHPGLARFLKEHDAWEDEWDDRIYN